MSENEKSETNTTHSDAQHPNVDSAVRGNKNKDLAPDQNPVTSAQGSAGHSTIVKNALKMAFGTMTSRVLGLVRESLLAALFDKSITDAFNAAFKIPNLFRRLLGEGSLSVSFIPVFVEAKAHSQERAQNLVNSFYTILLILLTVLTALGVFFSDEVLKWILSPEYVAQTEKMALTAHMAKIMFLFIFFISSFAFVMGILNSMGEFFWPAIAPTFWNIAMVISTIWPKNWLPSRFFNYGDQLAWGVVLGGVLQVGVLIPALIKCGYLPKPNFSLKALLQNSDSLRVFRNMGPGLIGMGLLQLNTVINLRFSSQFSEGTVSYINYIDRLIELPLSLISVSLGTALLPTLSGYWTENRKEEFTNTTRRALQLNLYLSIFAAVGLYALSVPIVDLLYGRGKFTASDVQATALILQSYVAIMIFSSGVRVLTPAYFAIKNTWFPALVSGICVTVHVVLAPVLMARLQVQGLMLSTILSAALNLTLLLVFYSKFIGAFPFLNFFKTLFLFCIAGALFYAVLAQYRYFNWIMQLWLGENGFANAVSLLFMLIIAMLSFFVISYIFRVDDVMVLLKKLRSRIRKAT